MRQMYMLENIEGRCDNCILEKGCKVLEQLDLLTTDLNDYENYERLLCPAGVNIINGRLC